MIQTITNTFAVYRDDAFPFLGGGNKARKMMALHKTIKKNSYDAIVTTGGIQSNHCRATVLYCKKYDIKCWLILHGDEKKFYSQSGNAKIMRESCAKIQFCKPEDISTHMNQAMDCFRKNDNNPFYLYGGGHTLEGGHTYIDAIEEISKNSFVPDYIFLASGSGTTQAGILAGISKFKLKTKVIGISVGRKKNVAEENVSIFYKKLCDHFHITDIDQKVLVDDSYLCGGYEKYNDEMKKISDDSLMNYGFALDTTYTAKAFYGMKDIIKTKDIHGKILFWYTGGIYNFLAQ